MKLTFTADLADDGLRLKSVFHRRLDLSASLLKKLKTDGEILLNGERAIVTAAARPGDLIELIFPEEKSDFPAENGDISVLWEDEFFLTAEKPRGMLTHPSHSRYTGTLANFALNYILNHGGDACHAVNRLDRDTSGIVLFAKNAYAKSLASGLDFEKLYVAAVFSRPERESGVISAPIRRAAERDMRRIVAPDGKSCVTHYTLLRALNGYSIVKLRLETGRTHQIRVHMAHIGCPLLGDSLYQSEASAALSMKLGIHAQQLHAYKLAFRHPVNGSEVSLFSAPAGILSGFVEQ